MHKFHTTNYFGRSNSMNVIVLVLLVSGVGCDVIHTKNGFVSGKTFRSRSGRWYRAFFGIPYAMPPVGELRLKAPVESKPWTGVKECLIIPPKCPQPEHLRGSDSIVTGEEDCLYLNIFTPKHTSRIPYPVIVFIHGGGFHVGEGVEHRPEFLLDQDVILVNFNYRLGSLGFLSMGDSVIPGNFGLKDQAMALKWIRRNILGFGGNPNCVTLMGHSAGAASAHLHLFSPLSKGFFHRIIMQSGNAHSFWAFYEDSRAKELGRNFANLTGCGDANSTKVLECLQKLPVSELIRKRKELYVWRYNPSILFRPVVEYNVANAFLPRKPGTDSYLTTNVPWLTGMTTAEAASLVLPYLTNNGELVNEINNDYQRLIPLICEYMFTAPTDHMAEVTDKIKQFYFDQEPIGTDTDTQLTAMVTDALFMYPMIKSILYDKGKRFVYLYDHRGSFSYQDSANYSKDLGVSHSDELPLLFFLPQVANIRNINDLRVSERLIRYWTNFAKFGDPNGNVREEKFWRSVGTNNVKYLHISTQSDEMETNLFRDKYKFWNALKVGR